MKRLILLALLATGCGGPLDSQQKIPILVSDDAAPLTSGAGAPLFEIRYCDKSNGPSFLVSELRTELEAQVHWHSGYNFGYLLTTDLNRDHRFGPGDVITVSQGDYDDFWADDASTTFKVSLVRRPDSGAEEIIGEADWQAR